MSEPYHAAVRVLSTDDGADPEQAARHHTGPVVIEITIMLQQDAAASVPSIPVELPPLPAVLTRREQDVMDLVSQRYTNREIAERLVLEESTVKHHVKRILAKLNVTNRYEAIEAVGRPLLLARNA